jgi:hypothetical protein
VKSSGILLLLLLGGCVAAASSHDEVARSASPDGRVDAIVIESNGGATTSFSYALCFAPHGSHCTIADSVVNLYGATRNAQAYGINARWANNSLVKVEYLKAQRTTTAQHAIVVDGRHIQIQLHPGVVDSSAPSGGMLYNLDGRPQDAP